MHVHESVCIAPPMPHPSPRTYRPPLREFYKPTCRELCASHHRTQVEGHEEAVLRGAETMVNAGKVDVLIMVSPAHH